ncbi:NgoFVII family restriction endonuclease [Wielerella bovis]|uniref:restriction endonuclease PLD domain-containing protein n=1 Tax=Wielerella bovis TaxID=2917790 RepID=UPI00201860E8|nr:restriction endonuclease PLD domain-containing protein [Wielerella bovis]ULJ61983.1 NgoFVII family restriction endonuclease [Wielerella bovis]
MKTIFSNFGNAKITQGKNLNDVWLSLFKDANEVVMATGYVSGDAIAGLYSALERNLEIDSKTIHLLVGMQYLEGFTQRQYNGLLKLNQFLMERNRGQVYLSPFMKFHGKLYAFKQGDTLTGMIGSANLSSFWDNLERTYETMFVLDDFQAANLLYQQTNELITKLGKPIHQVDEPTHFHSHNVHLEEHLGVCKIDMNKVRQLQMQESQYSFSIPMKTEPKSNLNVFFGKGREDKRGFIIPRPWYEIELIVSKKTTELEGYPCHKLFTVITDDGWQFKCKTSGDFAKNLRSEGDLQILGKWIKGKLENSGALEVGDMVTEETLKQYGQDTMMLRSTDDPNIWLLSF